MQNLCQIKPWFRKNQRNFPWREDRTPYRVWVSEVMLQQTRASVVVDYFIRWMKIFPTIEALACRSEEEVIKVWEGLGYYSRARNLHKGAMQVVNELGGVMPNTWEGLIKIRGIGPYTAGAILSFAFGQKAPAIDANVKRVLARYLGHEEKLHENLEELLPERDAPVVMEGLIELGATLCGQKPLCPECPLFEGCVARREGLTAELPSRKKRQPTTHLYRFVACIECEGSFLIKKGEAGKVMEGLWEFPYLECDGEPVPSELLKKMEGALGLKLSFVAPLSKTEHHFTRFKALLFPYLIRAKEKLEVRHHEWHRDLKKLPFSSGHRRVRVLVQD